jgi:hypothetical protein
MQPILYNDQNVCHNFALCTGNVVLFFGKESPGIRKYDPTRREADFTAHKKHTRSANILTDDPD